MLQGSVNGPPEGSPVTCPWPPVSRQLQAHDVQLCARQPRTWRPEPLRDASAIPRESCAFLAKKICVCKPGTVYYPLGIETPNRNSISLPGLLCLTNLAGREGDPVIKNKTSSPINCSVALSRGGHWPGWGRALEPEAESEVLNSGCRIRLSNVQFS